MKKCVTQWPAADWPLGTLRTLSAKLSVYSSAYKSYSGYLYKPAPPYPPSPLPQTPPRPNQNHTQSSFSYFAKPYVPRPTFPLPTSPLHPPIPQCPIYPPQSGPQLQNSVPDCPGRLSVRRSAYGIGLGTLVPYDIFEERLIGEFSELQLQFSLILRFAGQIWQILQISALICRILRIPPNSANSQLKFLSKKLAKVCSQKILQSRTLVCQSSGLGHWF